MIRYGFSREFARRMVVVSGIVGLIISLALPLTYLFLSVKDRQNQAAIRGEVLAKSLENEVRLNPDLWYYNVPKFVQIVGNLNRDEGVDVVRIYNEYKTLIYERQIQKPFAVSFDVQTPIRYNNVTHGFVVLEYGLDKLAFSVVLLLAAFILLGITIALFIYKYPVAIVQNAEASIITILRELETSNQELTWSLQTIEQTQKRLIQQEKLAGLGQLAAGVAHEINNPLGYVTSNVEALEKYFAAFQRVLTSYRALQSIAVNDDTLMRDKINEAIRSEQAENIDYVITDLPELFQDTLHGLDRMKQIVKGLRAFSHIDQQQSFKQYNLVEGIESTLLVAQNEIKHCAEIKKELAAVPDISAVGGEINQVLLNLLINAAHAIQAKNSPDAGWIRVAVWSDEQFVYCSIEDNGIGIEADALNNLFNPFFTTKSIGEGTGLGLSISYDLIVNRHQGDILVESVAGQGAKFTLKLPKR